MKFIAGLCAAVAVSTVGAVASIYAAAAVEKQAQASLTGDVTAVGCLRAWKPAPEDVTRLPENREPGMAGMFVLTPLSSSPSVITDLPTYLLTPTATVNFQQHLDRKVEIIGVAQTAPMPPTVQEIVTAPTPRPENRPNPQSFPRLTVKSLTKLADTCPS
jgi:hypothetical protein